MSTDTEQADQLTQSSIRDRLAPAVVAALDSLDVFDVVESTNDYLRSKAAPEPGRLVIALADYQTGGRGRRGRTWLSPAGAGLCMSLGWTFPEMPADSAALSLASGVGVCRALSVLEPAGLGLKWPNDIVAGGAKLGGLLIEAQGEPRGAFRVVIGIGLNVEPVGDLATLFDEPGSLPPVGLRSIVGGRHVARNELAAAIVNAMLDVLLEFQSSGFAAFADEWRGRDAMVGVEIHVSSDQRGRDGVAVGISDDGALLFEDEGGTHSVLSGEVTLRRAVAEPDS